MEFFKKKAAPKQKITEPEPEPLSSVALQECPFMKKQACPFPMGGCPYQDLYERKAILVPEWCPLT